MSYPDPTPEEVEATLTVLAQSVEEAPHSPLPMLADDWSDAAPYARQLVEAGRRILQRAAPSSDREEILAKLDAVIDRLDILAERAAERG